MKRLILMRHAKSDWSATGDDHSRPLNTRGEKSAPAMGRWVRQRGWIPDEVLCSTATRTRQTLDLLELDPTPTRFERSLYLADAETMMAELQSATGNTVLLIGHNSGIADFAHRLVRQPAHHARFLDYPTCATTLIAFDIDDWSDLTPRSGEVVDFAIPREVLAAEAAG